MDVPVVQPGVQFDARSGGWLSLNLDLISSYRSMDGRLWHFDIRGWSKSGWND